MLRIKSTIIILTLIFIFISIKIWSEPIQKEPIAQSKTKKLSQQNSSEQQKPSGQFIAHQQLIDAITRGIDANNDNYKTTHNPSQPDNYSYWFNFFLVVFTGGLVIVGAVQCYIIFKTLKTTQTAADSARDNVKALKDIERAQIHIFVNRFPDSGPGEYIVNILAGHNQAKITIMNFGRTPAIITKLNCKLGVFSDTEKIINMITEMQNQQSIIPPEIIIVTQDKPWPYLVKCNISSNDENNIGLSAQFIYACFGRVEYRDVFGTIYNIPFRWEDNGIFFVAASKHSQQT